MYLRFSYQRARLPAGNGEREYCFRCTRPRSGKVQAGGVFYLSVIQCVACLCAEMSGLRQNKYGETLDRLNKVVYFCPINSHKKNLKMATFETTGIKKHETEKAVLYAIPHFHCKNPDDKMDVEVWIPKSLIYKAATHFTGKFDIIRVDAKLLNQKIHKPMIGIYSAGYWQPIGVAE